MKDLNYYKNKIMNVEEFVRQNEKMNSSLITDWNKEMLLEAIQKYADQQLILSDFNPHFELGKRVKIDRCIYGHNFEIGQTVEIIDHEKSQKTDWLCTDGTNSWWISEDEGNVC
jgi:hypothetical protein